MRHAEHRAVLVAAPCIPMSSLSHPCSPSPAVPCGTQGSVFGLGGSWEASCPSLGAQNPSAVCPWAGCVYHLGRTVQHGSVHGSEQSRGRWEPHWGTAVRFCSVWAPLAAPGLCSELQLSLQ